MSIGWKMSEKYCPKVCKCSHLPRLARIPRAATVVSITPSTHHLNMESGVGGVEGRVEGEMMVARDIRS